jgi:hypothetical protein
VCLGGASTPTPSDGTTGVLCIAGEACPAGATAVGLCTPGSYCLDPLTGAPTGLCAAGYWCGDGSSTPTPAGELNLYGDSIGDECPKGSYCPMGTSTPQRCPTGTFSNNTGNVAAVNCTPCLAGWQCDVTGLILPLSRCNATYYCPAGTVTPTLLCTPGNYCAGGNSAPVACAAGTYSNASGLAACLPCPATTYCPSQTSSPLGCPAGYYCGGGSATGVETPCPAGTYSSTTRLSLVSQCTSCDAGWYCGTPGLTAPTARCDPGFYCTGGSNVSAPTVGFSAGYVCSTLSGYGLGCPAYFNRTSNSSYGPSSLYVALSAAPVGMGDVCPAGHYCPLGSSAPTPCPPATFISTTNTPALSGCLACSPGFLCPRSGTATPTVPCPATQYCPGGNNASGITCPAGSRCTGGTSAPEL